jgi:hypothetical protein
MPDTAIARVKMLLELRVVLEPPEGGIGKEQKIAAPGSQRFQVSDRRGAVGRIVTSIRAVLILWEVPSAPAI